MDAVALQITAAELQALQPALEYLGTVAFAISGALLAGRKRMDFGGAVMLGVLVSVGGGTVRDLIVGNLPVFWIQDPQFLILGSVVALLTIPLTRIGAIAVIERHRLVLVFDAAGMALFVISGTIIALRANANWFAAAVVGVITGVTGGIIRDVLANEVPDVLVTGEFYALAAFAGSFLYILLLRVGVSGLVSSWLPVVVIFGIRLLSIRYGWKVPTFEVSDDELGQK